MKPKTSEPEETPFRTSMLDPEDDDYRHQRSVPQGWDLSDLLHAPGRPALNDPAAPPPAQPGPDGAGPGRHPELHLLDCTYLDGPFQPPHRDGFSPL